MSEIAIVTGAYGYIGSVLTKILKENGYSVIGIDKKIVFDESRIKYCDVFYNESLISKNFLEIISMYDTASIFHLAANSLLGPSAEDPLSYYENNTFNTLKILNSLSPRNNFIFASTAAVYGITDKPVKETDGLNPPNNYGRSKLWCEEMMQSSYKILNHKITSFRFFNVIGAYDDVGQECGTPHIISQLSKSSLNNNPFYVYGNDYPTNDGTCVRDYLHVIDVCRALIHSDKIMKEKYEPTFDIYNLGTNKGTSVKEIVDYFNKVAKPVNVEYKERRVGDPPFLVANPEKFINETGFKYIYNENNINEMIESTWRYYNGI